MPLDVNKFNWVQLFNNSKGKTSPTLVVSFFGAIVSLIVFCVCSIIVASMVIIEAKTDITNVLTGLTMQSVGLFTVSIGALTARRYTQDKEVKDDNHA